MRCDARAPQPKILSISFDQSRPRPESPPYPLHARHSIDDRRRHPSPSRRRRRRRHRRRRRARCHPKPNRARHQSIGNIPHLTPTPVESNPRSRTRHPRAIRDARDPRWIPARAIANVPRAARARSRTSPPARARSIANNARIPSRAPNPIPSHRIASRVTSHHAPWLAREVRRVTPLGARRVDDDGWTTTSTTTGAVRRPPSQVAGRVLDYGDRARAPHVHSYIARYVC